MPTKSKAGKGKTGKKKLKRVVHDGIAHIQASFNNTLITISDLKGDAICQSSAGHCKFSGARKSTQHAAKIAAETAGQVAKDLGMQTMVLKIKGPGPGRDMAGKALAGMFKIIEIIDTTKIPHNGCRPPNERRV